MPLSALRLPAATALLTVFAAAFPATLPALAADPITEKTESKIESETESKTENKAASQVTNATGSEPTVIWGHASAIPAAPPRRVEAPYVGLCTEPLTLAQCEKHGVPQGTGLSVLVIAQGSPSMAAGLAHQDILLTLDDQILINPAQLRVLVRLRKAGEPAMFGILRQGKKMTVEVRPILQALPELTPGGEESRVTYVVPAPGQTATRTLRFAPGEQTIPPEVLKDMPPELRAQIERMNRDAAGSGRAITSAATLAPADQGAPRIPGPSRVTARDARHTVVVEHATPGRLRVTANADGKVLYDGPIPADDPAWEAVPADIRAKAKTLSGQATPRHRPPSAPTPK